MIFRIESTLRLAVVIAAVLMFAIVAQGAAQPAGTPGTTIVVQGAGDGNFVLPGDPVLCTLRDAIQAANTNLAVGGCPAGRAHRVVSAQPLRVDFIDRIVFNIGSGTPRILLRTGLPQITEAVTIDGATGGATRVEISGPNIQFIPVQGLVVLGTFTTLKSLVVNGFRGSGIVLTHEDGDGIIIVTPPMPERPQPGPGDPIDPCGPQANPADPSQCPQPGGNPDDNVTTIGAAGGGGHTVIDCLIGTNAAGTQAVPNGNGTPSTAGVIVLVAGNVIGGTGSGMRNVIAGNRGHGVLLESVNNRVIGNFIGYGAGPGPSLGNLFDGVFVGGGQFGNATCEIRQNTIRSNGGDGVDAGINVCSIRSNSISANGGLGIERAATGVTQNDPSGTRRRPPNFPVIEGSGSVPGTGPFNGIVLFGTINQQSSQSITLDFFYGSACDPSGNGEGLTFVGSTTAQGGLFRFQDNALRLSGIYTATATTVDGGTSEFSRCFAR
jgi:hypothetical protein